METQGIGADRAALAGKLPAVRDISALLAKAPRNSPSNVVSVRDATLGGTLYSVNTAVDGARRRFAMDGYEAPLTPDEIQRAALRVSSGSVQAVEILAQDDACHYSVGEQRAQLPAIRVISAADPPVFYYLDPIAGELIDKADRGGHAYRWWHSALHRLDFLHALRTTGARMSLMLPLLLGASFVCAVGAYLGLRRWIR